MAVDTFAKRMVVAGTPVPGVLGPNVFPGTTNVILGRAAAAWNYSPETPTPPLGSVGDPGFVIGQKRSFSDRLELGGGGW